MNEQDIVGKDLYYREDKLGEIVELRKDPLQGTGKVAIIETSKNEFKATPVEYLNSVANRIEFQRDRKFLDDFPKLSSKDIEEERDAFKNALQQQYGSRSSWGDKNQDEPNTGIDKSYMGSSQITQQEPEDNQSMKGKMDFDKLKRGE